MARPWLLLSSALLVSLCPSLAFAGTITPSGNLVALDEVSEIQQVVGTAPFDGMLAPIPLDEYSNEGMTLHSGDFAQILPGVMEVGTAAQPFFWMDGNFFPEPIAGGGVAEGGLCLFGAVVTFSESITQFGLTASNASTIYITVWDQLGALIGQVEWSPDEDSAFVGLDTLGVPIGMLALGNDDVWGGMAYVSEGPVVATDTWIWGFAQPCQDAMDCPVNENACLSAVCDQGFCTQAFNQDPCDDGNACTSADMCTQGACVGELNEDPCDDGDACTEIDMCSEGECVGQDVDCDDGNICSLESCDMDMGCVYDFIEGCCVSDEDCAQGEVCLQGSNSCIPDPDPGDGDGDPGDGDGDTGDGDGDPDSGDGDGDGDPGDGDGDPATGDGDGEEEDPDGPETSSEGGNDTTSTGGATGDLPIDDESGCSCRTPEHEGKPASALLTLLLLGLRRRD